MTLHEFIEADLTTEMDNGQVRMIAGFGGFHKADPKDQGYCSESDLKKAIHNLDNFFIGFGIKEYFDESLLLLSKKAGWGAMNYLSKNVNKKQKKSEAIPQKTLELIKDKNKFDLQFYKYAKQNFEETLNSEGSKFSCEKRKLELSNKLILRYSRLRPYFLK